MTPLPLILVAIGAYLLGSIPVGYLMMKWGKGIDIRTVGSGNIGMTNVWRAAGWRWGVPVLMLDIAKGFLGVAAPMGLFPSDGPLGIGWYFVELSVTGGIFVMLGNIFPIFLGFKGGKGIGVGIGIFGTLLPLPTAIAFGMFVMVVLATRMISAGSILAVLALATSTLLLREPFDILPAFAILAAVIVIWTHRSNIRRILAGQENRIGSRSKTRSPGRNG